MGERTTDVVCGRRPKDWDAEARILFVGKTYWLATMRMPDLGYVREWILRNTRILASIDLQPDMFQPGVGIQTGVLILQRRKPQELIDVETTANKTNDCPVFVAIANNVGHDKRGTKPRFTIEKGMKSFRKSNKLVKEWRDRTHVYRRQPPRKKLAVGSPHSPLHAAGLRRIL